MPLLLVRFTMKWLMLAVAILALVFVVAHEFSEGSPPLFVRRDIPLRIARLRPGMSPAQARKVLGLDRSWIWGGLSAEHARGGAMALRRHENYTVGPLRQITWKGRERGVLKTFSGPSASTSIGLVFAQTINPEHPWPPGGESDRLVSASASVDGKIVTMPGHPEPTRPFVEPDPPEPE